MKNYKAALIVSLLLFAGSLLSCSTPNEYPISSNTENNTKTNIDVVTDAENGKNVDENTSVTETGYCTEDFIKLMEGVWVDLNDCYADDSMALFEFFSISNGVIYSAHSHGHVGRKGEIIKAVELTDSLYQVTIFFPEVNNEMDGYLEERTTEYEIKFLEDSFFFIDTPEYIYTYMGENFDSAYKAVFEHCYAINNRQNENEDYYSPQNKTEHQYSAVALKGAVITEVDSITKTLKYKRKCETCGFVDNSTYRCNIPVSGTTTSSFLCTKCKNVQEIAIQGSMK